MIVKLSKLVLFPIAPLKSIFPVPEFKVKVPEFAELPFIVLLKIIFPAPLPVLIVESLDDKTLTAPSNVILFPLLVKVPVYKSIFVPDFVVNFKSSVAVIVEI